MPKKRRPPRSFHKGARVGTRTFPIGSTRPEELEVADRMRPSPLDLARLKRDEPPEKVAMNTVDTAQMSISDLAIAVLRELGRPASPKEVHELIAVSRPGVAYDSVNRGMQRSIYRPETGIKRKQGMYFVDGQGSTVEPEDTVATSKRMFVKNDLMEYLSKRPGQTVYAADAAKDMGIDDEQKIRNAIGNIRQAHGDDFPIETVVPARAWIYRPPSAKPQEKKGDTLFKLIGGPTRDGSFILEREDGTLYQAKEM